MIAGAVYFVVIVDLIENEELGFRTKVTVVGNACEPKVVLRAHCNRSGIELVPFFGHRVDGVSKHAESRLFEEGVDPESAGIGYQQHVRFVDRGPAAKARGIESYA